MVTFETARSFVGAKSTVFVKYLLLSWLFALCSQIIIPLPFSPVPISLQPAPLLLAAFIFGWHAVNAYILYLGQGALGAPFFSGFHGGLPVLFGPRGGYLLGFLLAMIFIAALKHHVSHSIAAKLAILVGATFIYFCCGLLQLSLFVPHQAVLAVGLYPFIVGDSIKLLLVFLCSQYKALL